MNQALKNISNDFMYNYSPKLSNQELSLSLINFISNNLRFIDEAARSSLNIYEDNNECEQFIEEYKKNLDSLKEYTKTAFDESRENIKEILINELNFLYKNFQIIYKNKFHLNTEFIVTENCCDVCKFLSKTNCDLTYHFQHDDCESYLQLQPEIIHTINIFSPRFKIKNAPTRYKNAIESFLRILIMKYNHLLKDKLNLVYFNDSLEYDKPNMFSFYKGKWIYQKFNIHSYKDDILRHLLNVEENELTKQIYYSYIDDKNIFQSSHFINFIAEQNSFDYLRESMIAYLLHPNDLYLIDKKIFNYFKEREK